MHFISFFITKHEGNTHTHTHTHTHTSIKTMLQISRDVKHLLFKNFQKESLILAF